METTTTATPTQPGTKTLTLPSGKTAILTEGKGKHAMEAGRIANGDQAKFMPALVSLLVVYDGRAIVMEDIEEMPLNDYLSIMAEFGSNFI